MRFLVPALCVLGLWGCGDAETGPDGGPSPDAAPGVDASEAPGSDAGADVDDDGGAPIPGPMDAGHDAAEDDDAGHEPDATVPELPQTLAQSGLYAAGSTTELANGVFAFEPRYPLWSDGATKRRWFSLPPGTQIDTSDMDYWQYPVGTKLWKEFTRDNKRIETRLLMKRDVGWYMVAFAWNDADNGADAVPDGVDNAMGTDHDVPTVGACRDCHSAMVDKVLSFSAIQLSHAGSGMTLDTLIAMDLLTDPPADDFALPDTDEWNVMGYLHANCGNCHNPTHGEVWDKAGMMQLWLETGKLAAVSDTESYKTTVGVAIETPVDGFSLRIDPGQAAKSLLSHRVGVRDGDLQMPPIGTELTDDAAWALLNTWIVGL